MTSPFAQVLIAPIRFYQRFITPYTPASCRYYPTCSAYAVTALRNHGAVIGTGLTVWRLLRCNPWSSGGIDYPPAKGELLHRHADDVVAADVASSDAAATVPETTAAATRVDVARSSADRHSGDGERGEPAGSSTTVCSAEHRVAGTDCTPDAPPSVAGDPMIGRSAA